ncbi:glycosyltransferase family 4 protein [Halorubrum distributum]|nr:glycosyltransferase family 4 protein [Halorubrum terrestre]
MDSLHLTTAHTPTDTRIFDKEATSLAETGFEVGILAHDTPDEDRNGVQFVDLGSADTRAKRWWNIPQVARTARCLDASIYHFHDPELIPVGIYLSATTDAAVVYDVHEDFGHKAAGREWIPDIASIPLSHIVPQIEQFASSQFDAIVSATDRIGSRFSRTNERVTTLYNFPRTAHLPPATQSKRRNRNHVLCYVGGLSELRGIHRMLELLDTLYSRNIDVELWALGSWSTEVDKHRAKEFIAERDLESRVQFPGYLDYEEMFQYLYGADLGLSLLDTQQFETAIPTKQFEYLYAGLPTITTPLNAAIRFLPDRFRHVVPQGDTEATADAVERALESDYDVEEMRSLVEREYSWESEAEKLIALYEDLLR